MLKQENDHQKKKVEILVNTLYRDVPPSFFDYYSSCCFHTCQKGH